MSMDVPLTPLLPLPKQRRAHRTSTVDPRKIGRAVMEGLNLGNRLRAERAAQLREVIRNILRTHEQVKPLSANHVLLLMGEEFYDLGNPGVRCIQTHLKFIRETPAALRIDV